MAAKLIQQEVKACLSNNGWIQALEVVLQFHRTSSTPTLSLSSSFNRKRLIYKPGFVGASSFGTSIPGAQWNPQKQNFMGTTSSTLCSHLTDIKEQALLSRSIQLIFRYLNNNLKPSYRAVQETALPNADENFLCPQKESEAKGIQTWIIALSVHDAIRRKCMACGASSLVPLLENIDTPSAPILVYLNRHFRRFVAAPEILHQVLCHCKNAWVIGLDIWKERSSSLKLRRAFENKTCQTEVQLISLLTQLMPRWTDAFEIFSRQCPIAHRGVFLGAMKSFELKSSCRQGNRNSSQETQLPAHLGEVEYLENVRKEAFNHWCTALTLYAEVSATNYVEILDRKSSFDTNVSAPAGQIRHLFSNTPLWVSLISVDIVLALKVCRHRTAGELKPHRAVLKHVMKLIDRPNSFYDGNRFTLPLSSSSLTILIRLAQKLYSFYAPLVCKIDLNMISNRSGYIINSRLTSKTFWNLLRGRNKSVRHISSILNHSFMNLPSISGTRPCCSWYNRTNLLTEKYDPECYTLNAALRTDLRSSAKQVTPGTEQESNYKAQGSLFRPQETGEARHLKILILDSSIILSFNAKTSGKGLRLKPHLVSRENENTQEHVSAKMPQSKWKRINLDHILSDTEGTVILVPFSVAREVRSLCRSTRNKIFHSKRLRQHFWKIWCKLCRLSRISMNLHMHGWVQPSESKLKSTPAKTVLTTNPGVTPPPIAFLALSQEIPTRCMWPRVVQGDWSIDTQLLCISTYIKYVLFHQDLCHSPLNGTLQISEKMPSSPFAPKIILVTNDQQLSERAKELGIEVFAASDKH